MPRNFSEAFNDAANSQEFGQVVLWLLTIEHENGFMRKVKGWQDIESNGRQFEKSAFVMTLPTEGEDTPPVVNIQFDAGDTQIVTILRGDTEPPKVYLELCLASDPNVIELGPLEFEVKKYSRSGPVMSVELGYEPALNEPIPCDTFSASLFPGLF